MAKPVKRKWTAEERLAQRERIEGFRFAREAERAEATRKVARFRYIRGDLHVHTVYSDGSGTVDDVVRVGQERGLDFMFVTDHSTVRQRTECRKYSAVWWGQEPGAGPHHVCVLAGDRKFVPRGDMKRDAERLRALGHFFFYPHPVGWYPACWYTEEQKDALREVGPEFAIEIINGIFRTDPFHDEWTEANVALWDRYLCEGYRVTGLAATDSHFAPGVGNVWTGVIGARRTLQSVLRALRAGRVFASSGPAVRLTCGRTPMGAIVRSRPERKACLSVRCADARGLSWAKVVQDGRPVREFTCQGRQVLDEQVDVALPRRRSYVRVECAAVDDRRAYSNPIYFRPED